MSPQDSSPRELPTLALSLDDLSQPTPAQTAPLLKAAAQLWKQKPWKKLVEDEIFIVQLPGEEPLFVSVLGRGGQQSGVVIYRGADAYFGLLDFTARAAQLPAIPTLPEGMEGGEEFLEMLAAQLGQMNFDPMELLQLPQLQLMFEPRGELSEIDEEWITRHKYKATGRGFPTCRSIVPGYLPWWITDDEAGTMTLALQQLSELLARADFSPELFEMRENEGEAELFARVATKNPKGELEWNDARVAVGEGELLKVEIAPDQQTMQRIKALPIGKDVLEMELISVPTPLGGFEERPYFPSLLLAGKNGVVAGMETIPCGPGPYRLPLLLDAILKLLSAQKKRPKAIHFASSDLSILTFVGQELGIAIKEVAELPTLDPAIESLMAHLSGMDGAPEDWDEDDDGPEIVPRLLH